MSKTKHAATLAAVLMAETATHEHKFGRAQTATRDKLSAGHPEAVAADALALIRIGAGVARWAVLACNGIERSINGRWQSTWWDEDDARKEKADKRALAKLQAIADRYGATVKLGGDPRGYVVKLQLASGRHNTMGGSTDGWGVA